MGYKITSLFMGVCAWRGSVAGQKSRMSGHHAYTKLVQRLKLCKLLVVFLERVYNNALY